jgi:hypothetical protein
MCITDEVSSDFQAWVLQRDEGLAQAAGKVRGRVADGHNRSQSEDTDDVSSSKRFLQRAQENNELFVRQFETSL